MIEKVLNLVTAEERRDTMNVNPIISQSMNLQQQNAHPNFAAKIINSDYLNAGFKYAKGYAPLIEKRQFLNALEYIEKDKNMQTFRIMKDERHHTQHGKTRNYQIKVDGKPYNVNNSNHESAWDGAQCVHAVVNFIREYYGNNVAFRVLQQSTPALNKAEQLEAKAKIYRQKGEREIRNRLCKIAENVAE